MCIYPAMKHICFSCRRLHMYTTCLSEHKLHILSFCHLLSCLVARPAPVEDLMSYNS